MDKWCETLVKEHEIIITVLQAAEEMAGQIVKTGSCDEDKVGLTVEFIREFADKFHHAKEENLLFKKMEEKGIPNEGGPIGMMLAEHEQGRGYVRAVAGALAKVKAGDQGAVKDIAQNLTAFTGLLGEHIYKEDNILYPMAEKAFSKSESGDLGQAFEIVEMEMGGGIREKYHAIARQLAGLQAV